MSAADAVFNQVDLNKDGRVDLGEFRNFVGQNLGAGWSTGWGAGASAYDLGLSGAVVDGGVIGGGLVSGGLVSGGLVGTGLVGTGLVGSGLVNTGVVNTGLVNTGLVNTGLVNTGLVSNVYDASYAVGGGVVGAGVADASLVLGGSVVDSSLYGVNQVQYAANAQGLYQDPNPQVITRPNPAGVQTYTQNVQVRFLQPPPVPPPGPLVIKEVRPPQPPLPPPLRLRQVAPPLPPPPPLVLRERPPVPPPVIPSQTVIRRLPGIPVPPRSVVVERFPPPPPKPRDIFLERWLPYGPQPKRRTLVQRAPAPVPYPAPKNVIIQYEQAPARVLRNFQRLGVVSGSPAAYVQSYGASLLDGSSLVSTARSAGVVEDITPPGYVGYGMGAYGHQWGAATGLVGGVSGAEFVDGGVVASDVALGGWNGNLVAGGLAGWNAGLAGWNTGLAGWNTGLAGWNTGLTGWNSGLVAGNLGYGGLLGSTAVVNGADAAFLNADSDYNGTLDRQEFRNLLAQNL